MKKVLKENGGIILFYIVIIIGILLLTQRVMTLNSNSSNIIMHETMNN